MTLTSGYCYELTLRNGDRLQFRFLDNQGGVIRIELLPGGNSSDLDTEAARGDGYDPKSLQRIKCGDHMDNE